MTSFLALIFGPGWCGQFDAFAFSGVRITGFQVDGFL